MHEYGIISLAPVVVAIGLALKTRQIVLSLGAGVLLAALILQEWNPWDALIYTVDPLILDAIADRDHVKVTLFTLFVNFSSFLCGFLFSLSILFGFFP